MSMPCGPAGKKVLAALLCLLVLAGCGRPAVKKEPAPPSIEKGEIPRLGYTIQAGAFAKAENAARLTRLLQERGLEATYFVAAKGLYKVRFGNFATREAARLKAEEVRAAGIIEEFYIVRPEEHPAAVLRGPSLREELVKRARSFLGVPYLWGGTSPDSGFDCSGLAMTVYQLSGLVLPRTSQEQFAAGAAVDSSRLEKGDLVFFAMGGDKVSHVGIYAGEGQFIHAPGKGKRIRIDSLRNDYYRRRYLGGRSFL